MDKKIFSEVKDNIGIVWLNRPEKKNALNDELWFGLPELVKELDESDEVRVILIAAKGDTFSAGIDINLLVEAFDLNEDLRTNAEERIEIMEITKKFQDAFTTVAKTKKPTIAAIQGFSIGGATNLVASCDIRLSTKDAKFSIGESKLGLDTAHKKAYDYAIKNDYGYADFIVSTNTFAHTPEVNDFVKGLNELAEPPSIETKQVLH